MGERTCNECGWVAFGVTREHAEAAVAKFNVYFAGLTAKEQRDYYGGKQSSIAEYERCFLCGGLWTNFREAKPGDAPDGCTLNPIIHGS